MRNIKFRLENKILCQTLNFDLKNEFWLKKVNLCQKLDFEHENKSRKEISYEKVHFGSKIDFDLKM